MLTEYKIESTKDSLAIKWLEFSAFIMLVRFNPWLGKKMTLQDNQQGQKKPKTKQKIAKMWTAIASNNCLGNISV